MFWKRHIENPLCWDSMFQNIVLPQIGLARKRKTPYRKTAVFWKHHTRNPLCCDPMSHNIILLQIGLAQDLLLQNQNHTGGALYCGNTEQGTHCFVIPWSIILYYLRLAWPRKTKRHTEGPLCCGNAIQGTHCVLIPEYKTNKITAAVCKKQL